MDRAPPGVKVAHYSAREVRPSEVSIRSGFCPRWRVYVMLHSLEDYS